MNDAEFDQFLKNVKVPAPKEATVYVQDEADKCTIATTIAVKNGTSDAEQNERFMDMKNAADNVYSKIKASNAKHIWRVFTVYNGDEYYSRKFTWGAEGKYLGQA